MWNIDIDVDLGFFSLSLSLYLGFLSRTITIHRTAGEGEAISLNPLYHFQPLHRHFDISPAITVESPPLHMASIDSKPGTFSFWAQVALTIMWVWRLKG